jgi:DNA-binding transcriptional regulator YiaG
MNSEEIKELRQSMNLSQEAFAQEIGVTLNTVSRWENGHIHPNKLAIRAIQMVKTKYNLEVK